MDEVVDLIWSNEVYRERFTALIPADSEELFKAEFKEFFGEDNEAGEALQRYDGRAGAGISFPD